MSAVIEEVDVAWFEDAEDADGFEGADWFEGGTAFVDVAIAAAESSVLISQSITPMSP